MSERVLVFGAAGSQGGPVAQVLLEQGYQVVAAGRHPEKLQHLVERGAEAVEVDLFDPESVRQAAKTVSYAFFHAPMALNGPAAQGAERAALEAILESDVSRVAYNVGFAMPEDPVGAPPLDERINMVNELRKRGRLTVFVPTGYMENFIAPWSAPYVLQGELLYPLAPDVRVSWVTNADVGRCAAAAFGEPEADGMRLRVAGPEALTMPEVAEQLSEALDRAVAFRQVSGSEYADMLRPYVGDEVAQAVGSNYERIADQHNPLMTPDTADTERLLGIRFTRVVEWAKKQEWQSAAAAAE